MTSNTQQRLRTTAYVVPLLLVGLLCSPAIGKDQPVDEYEIKSAYLYNFAKFVAWPDTCEGGGDRPFKIGILGRDPFGTKLDALLRERTIRTRPIDIIRLDNGDDPTSCDILFVSGLEPPALSALIERTRDVPVLTVGDDDAFPLRGGIIGFFLEGGAVRFAINHHAAKRAGLTVNSRLLSLARIVQDGEFVR